VEQISVFTFLSAVGSLAVATRTARIGCKMGNKRQEKERKKNFFKAI